MRRKWNGNVSGLNIRVSDSNIYTSDFSAGVDGWAAEYGTAAGNIDSIGGLNDWLRFTCDSNNATHDILHSTPIINGRIYRLSFIYYIPSANSNLDQIRILYNSGSNAITNYLTATDAATSVVQEFTAAATASNIEVFTFDGGATPFQDAGADDVFYIKSVVFTDITENVAALFTYAGSVADDATFNLPTIFNAGKGSVVVGADEERADFSIKSDGTVNLIMASTNVVANADTDGKFCIGTSVASPCVIKNRLAGTKAVLLQLWYN